jgi:dGTPase
MMEWKFLLNPVRFRESSNKPMESDMRNEFENDLSRIIFSSPFRRLQDKAQVFPLEKSDFVRTRLTHSIEVSTLARRIGMGVENELILTGKIKENFRGIISSILATSGLVHDLGNPPFGHYGEKVIQDFFKQFIQENSKLCDFSEEEKLDFIKFDGNAHSFRILKKLDFLNDKHSYNLTYPTLATIIKYPRNSKEGNKEIEGKSSYKKFGYFQSEKESYKQIVKKLKMEVEEEEKRHPLVFLLEAADDIAYLVGDIEDGCKKGILSKEEVLKTFKEILGKGNKEEQNLLKELIEIKVEEDYEDELGIFIKVLKIKLQAKMVHAIIETFIEKHDEILKGEFDSDLLDYSRVKNIKKACKKLSYKIFKNKEILKTEISGGIIISFLLKEFTEAVISKDKENPQTKEGKLYNLISNNYRFLSNKYPYKNKSYNDLQLVTDYICGMTDTYAIDLYKRLKGIE